MDFDEIIEKQIDGLPKKLVPFLEPASPTSGMERTWPYFAYAYERAFEVMAKEYCRVYPGQSYLLVPLVQLARHSMELALKNALHKCNAVYNEDLPTDKHYLLPLYDRLNSFLILRGIILEGDQWSKLVRKVLVHVDQVDSTGMVFRYPTDRTGAPYDPFEIDIEALIIAHHHVTLLADATVTMLDDMDRY
ncbi:hypothetical protein [Agrobacterium rubi]|uniref:HEPN domain-containing protein n=1 Tax=Agrobacterium rubi TaxID=28099 RepID=A0AAE7UTB6_9HYPH|nr:hypothetical protein [Agrobacterium rubi]NTE89564.1 hypothetical protein [Agrobacterium rubi]NTF05700.1 hypothetical protein [Agrobacterium rubi]NTF39700.1 hypothetical protein [Agrobacterium rubi]OCJ50970.1 hypothetical protein A6U92_04760 [Agrobacterium rubi]QTG03522.1 hypothetical protein G6M88_23990 [Agrobacterium rubi]